MNLFHFESVGVSSGAPPLVVVLSEREVNAFSSSMPESYRAWYDAAAVRAHATVAATRSGRAAHAASWTTEDSDETGICVVADDRAGLMSLLAAGMAARRLEIVAARAYVHVGVDGLPEAIQLFSVRRLPWDEALGPITDEEVAELAESFEHLLRLRRP